MKDNSFAGVEVGRGDAQWNAQLFEGLHFQNAIEERDHAVIGGEAVTRERPAGKGGEANAVRDVLQFVGRETAAVTCADQSAYAGAANDADRNALCFEHPENANVR